MLKKFDRENIIIIDPATSVERSLGSVVSNSKQKSLSELFSEISNDTIGFFNKAIFDGNIDKAEKVLSRNLKTSKKEVKGKLVKTDELKKLFLASDLHSGVPIAAAKMLEGKDTKKHKKVLKWLLDNNSPKGKDLVVGGSYGEAINHGTASHIFELHLADNALNNTKDLDNAVEVLAMLLRF